jgi:hypothetical protein
MIVVIITVLAIIIATAALTTRSLDGLLGSRFQGDAKDARLVAESGTAYIISEWNKPANRGLYKGVGMVDWTTKNASLANPCTGPAPYTSGAQALDSTAVQFAAGKEISIDGDTSRRFVLRRVKFQSSDRSTTFTTSPSSNSGTTNPLLASKDLRGFVELEVEGRIYRGSNPTPVASSIIRREFQVEPKCCKLSFGGVLPNDTDPSNDAVNALGNDNRACASGTINVGDITIITGLSKLPGAGLDSDGTAAMWIRNLSGKSIDRILCVPATGTTTCGGGNTKGTLTTKDGALPYVVSPVTLPPPPSPPATLTPVAITKSTTINAKTIASDSTLSKACTATPTNDSPGGLVPAYHCNISSIKLSGTNTLTIDTTDAPIYLYLQANNSNISVDGSASIRHTNKATQAGADLANRFQIRGINTILTNPATDTKQTFNIGGTGLTGGVTLWAPYADTQYKGTSALSGLIWTNDLFLNGTTNITVPITNNTGNCSSVSGASELPCVILKDSNTLTNSGSPVIDWTARAITFTRMF